MKSSLEGEKLLSQYENKSASVHSASSRYTVPRSRLTPGVWSLLTISILANLAAYSYIFHLRSPPYPQDDGSHYAHLRQDTVGSFDYNTIYNSDNNTLTDAAWDAINYDSGIIALDHIYAAELGLPPAQQFPWDDKKGVYFISAYHSLHCLKSIRAALVDMHAGREPDHDYPHMMHCFEVLLEDIQCHADDTPLHTNELHPGRPGKDQARQCRDWSKLEAFTQQHYGCWRDVEPRNHDYDPLMRYRYCPEGSPYNEWINALWAGFDRDPPH